MSCHLLLLLLYLKGCSHHRFSLRLAIEMLSGRVQELSQFIVDQGLELPPTEQDYEKTLSNILLTAGLPNPQHSVVQSGTDSESSATQGAPVAEQPDPRTDSSATTRIAFPNTHDIQSAGNLAESPLQARQELSGLANSVDNMDATICGRSDWGSMAGAVSQEVMTNLISGPGGGVSDLAEKQCGPGTTPSCPSFEVDDDNNSTDGVDKLAVRLADPVGTIHVRPDGHIRFYGSTSNFSLLETPAGDVGLNVHWTVRNDGIEHLHRLGLNKKVPSEIERHLMNLYFTWQDPSFHVVDRRVFEEAKEVWHNQMEDTACYSESLRNAM